MYITRTYAERLKTTPLSSLEMNPQPFYRCGGLVRHSLRDKCLSLMTCRSSCGTKAMLGYRYYISNLLVLLVSLLQDIRCRSLNE